MLAQNFKTPADLGLSDIEFESLIAVLGMLERGELKHVPVMNRGQPSHSKGLTGHFNMDVVVQDEDCGTVACILGTCRLLNGQDLFPMVGPREGKIGRLFYPEETFDWTVITPEQAALALRNYLSTGDARWAEALAE
jgi:hypothetical protein